MTFRKRKEILKEFENTFFEGKDEYQIMMEVLLDIRDELIELNKQ